MTELRVNIFAETKYRCTKMRVLSTNLRLRASEQQDGGGLGYVSSTDTTPRD